MKLLSVFCRLFIGKPLTTFTEDLHVWLLNNWIAGRSLRFIYPQCTWHIADGYPYPGVYLGQDFHNRYTEQLTNTYQNWYEVVNTVIGSQIGGIVVGNYHFQDKMNGLWYTAPFAHFYRIHRRQICGVRFFIGDLNIQLHQITERAPLLNSQLLN